MALTAEVRGTRMTRLTLRKLQNMLTIVKEASEEKSLKMNADETEVMVISAKAQVSRCDVRVNDTTVKQVRRFCYVTEEG